jgi:2-oxoglutarate/2-oxoacid ferredoxin oxidoreductase subunit beta
VNTFQWYNKRVYKLEENYDCTKKLQAMEKAMEWGDKIPLGIIYKEEKPSYTDKVDFLREGLPLVDRQHDMEKIKGFMQDFI